MPFLHELRRIVFPADVDEAFSDIRREEAALRVAARLSRGNTNVQEMRVTTEREFEEQMAEYSDKVTNKRFFFQN
jgi:hypothetical protein